MKLTTEFYQDEVRYGFYVPTAIKQAWGAELQILAEIDRICKKYNIRYFAEWGTLIGAVRHGGFVPWDDDMDIGMLRKDYERFKEVAKDEFLGEFAIHDYATKENHWLFLSRVVNCNQICFEEEHLRKYHNFPYIATVDIFVMDYLYRDEEQEKARCEEIKHILAVADQIIEGRMQDSVREMFLQELENKYQTMLPRTKNARELGIALYRLAELQMARVSADESDAVAQIFPWVLKGNRGLPKKCYDTLVRLPFEEITIPVPADYDMALRYRYGDYMTIRKVWGGHDYPYFEGQRKNLQAVADFPLPEFTFQPEMLYDSSGHVCRNANAFDGISQNLLCDNAGRVCKEVDKKSSCKQENDVEEQTLTDIARQYVSVLDEMMEACTAQMQEQQYGDVLSVLPELQQLVVDFGTLLEEVRGEENLCVQKVVAKIQDYCDALYALYEQLNIRLQEPDTLEIGQQPADVSDADATVCASYKAFACSYTKMKAEIQQFCIARRSVLFICTGMREWHAYEHLCDEEWQKADTDVYIACVPTVFKDIYGHAEYGQSTEDVNTMRIQDHIQNLYGEFADNIQFMPWQKVNPALLAPGTIYIQDPYDGENPCLTIPPIYYAGNLRKYTKNLIYVPAYKVKEFRAEDTTDRYNMKHYVTAPALMYADQIYVQSENMRQRYLECLVEFSGEAYRAIWERKISVSEFVFQSEAGKGTSQKTILYCIGETELANLGKRALAHVESRLQIFADNHENLQVQICFYPPRLSDWEVDLQRVKTLTEMLRTYAETNKTWCTLEKPQEQEDLAAYRERLAMNGDAYYGSPSPYVHAFTLHEKPVMLASTEIEY